MKHLTDCPNARFVIRNAEECDCALILDFIRALAVYEKMENMVSATEEKLRDTLFQRRQAEVILGEYDGKPVAFALFFHNYSTFLGQAGIYLEDLFVSESHRGLGIGKAMFSALARIAKERDCGRLDWSCLDWNEKSIAFYRAMGAEALDDWTGYRLNSDGIDALALRGGR